MDHVAICISILLWLVRPQDWMSGFSGFSFMTWAMLAAMLGLWKRPGGVKVYQFLRSPADWLVISYLVWICWTTSPWLDTAKAMVPFAAFYFVTALALNTVQRLHTFLTCWVIGLAIAMIFALSPSWGFELAPGSQALTDEFLGRLALNTWIFNNPNSLGHGIAALIPAAYIWLVWKRPVPVRLLGLLVIAGAAQCVYLTESKGAYMCGAAAVTVSLIFRKSKLVQIFTLVAMLTAGVGAIQMLPRMETLDSKEGGIAGRLLIWQMAHNAMVNTKTGEGWKKFEAWIDTDDYGLIRKATHGSYVNVGADLGYVGLLLFVSILYANGRTLWQARPDPEDVDADRSQRLLLSLTTSFAASAWMIDRAYHTDFFILAGAVAAFHRLMVRGTAQPAAEEADKWSDSAIENESPSLASEPVALPVPALAPAGYVPVWMATEMSKPQFMRDYNTNVTAGQSPGVASQAMSDVPAGGETENNSAQPEVWLKWKRLELWDLVMVVAIFAAVVYLWQRLMTSFISF